MKKKLIAAITAFTILTTVLLAGCGNSTSQAGGKKKYIIATDVTFAPFEFQKDGKYLGIDIDLLNAIAKEENFELELKPMNFKGIIPALTSNQVDGAISGMTITDERKKVLDFSDKYYDSGLGLVVKQDNADIKSMNDLNGKTIAVKKGTSGAEFAEKNKDKYKLNIKYFDDTPSVFQEIKNDNAVADFEDYPVIAYSISVNPNQGLKVVGEKLTSEPYGFAVNKGKNKELLYKFNEGFKKLKANGQYDEIIAKYIKK
ncbi:transporter substrate-binding domain-containing protein [Clostridium pasteurianum]|uniref:Periplasmic component of amino acid ABC-type transporter/signal transduction system n=1 Tax=Clostridium pasteurianum BC1 TaxID=86416 RepID=R4KEN0_CLOPA|nr:transporter substrate-binding domain-containing protein [Clostridium pasteurianum]AGK98999.1 periplasmic component of amino acid ABC-type transporter/signal transduction system [Clostridium pasteurianum BC1]